MMRSGAIGPDHRANLRHLRASFEAAFDAIEDMSDRTSSEFAEADFRYRIWIKAIDGVAMALLDDIDSLEALIEGREQLPARAAPMPPERPETPDLADLFSRASDFDRTRELLGASELDAEVERLYEEP